MLRKYYIISTFSERYVVDTAVEALKLAHELNVECVIYTAWKYCPICGVVKNADGSFCCYMYSVVIQ